MECIFVEIMLPNIIIQKKATKLDKVVHVFHTLQKIVRVEHCDRLIFLFVSYYFLFSISLNKQDFCIFFYYRLVILLQLCLH